MSATVRRHRPDEFQIHEDAPSTEDTQMNTDVAEEEEEDAEQEDQEEEQELELEEDDEEESDGDDQMDEDMRKLQNSFPGFKQKYRLLKRIGEGTSRRSISPVPFT